MTGTTALITTPPVAFPSWLNAIFPAPRCPACGFARLQNYPSVQVHVALCDAHNGSVIHVPGWNCMASPALAVVRAAIPALIVRNSNGETAWHPRWAAELEKRLRGMGIAAGTVHAAFRMAAFDEGGRDHLISLVTLGATVADITACVLESARAYLLASGVHDVPLYDWVRSMERVVQPPRFGGGASVKGAR